jgi:branched-chain amino acid transport system substrate-binding protein
MDGTTGYGTSSKQTADKLIPSQGFKILASETYNIGDTDMTSQLQKMKTAGVKQIINFGLGPEDANLLISAQKIDYKVQFSGAWGWSDPLVPQLAGKELAEGVVTVASFTPDQSPAAADFHRRCPAYNEDPFPIPAAQAYDATKIMLMALSKSGPTRPSWRRDRRLDGFKGVTVGAEQAVRPIGITPSKARICLPRPGRAGCSSGRSSRQPSFRQGLWTSFKRSSAACPRPSRADWCTAAFTR